MRSINLSLLKYKMLGMAMFMALCMAHSAWGEMRTWTSATGATLEAALVDVLETEVVLEAANGKKFVIGRSMLSEVDQEFIHANSKSAPSTESKSSGPPGSLFPYEKAARLTAVPPSIKLVHPDSARYLLIQYGPGAGEVIHVVFDPSRADVSAEAAYIWSPSLPAFKTPSRLLGQSRKVEGNNAFVYTIPVSTSFGQMGVTGSIELTYGASQWWLIHTLGTFTLQTGAHASSLKVGGYIYENTAEASDPGKAEPVQLLSPVALHLSSNPTGMTTVRLWMNRRAMVPGKKMDRKVALTFSEKDGRKVDDSEVEVTENMLFKDEVGRFVYYSTPKYASGKEYLVHATIDLGPSLGIYEKEVSVKKP